MYIFKKQDKDFRNLTNEEINFLKSQGCSSQSKKCRLKQNKRCSISW